MFLLRILVCILPLAHAWACDCMGSGSPAEAAGRSAAVFSGTVLTVSDCDGSRESRTSNVGQTARCAPSG
jgi:hypothetical protein